MWKEARMPLHEEFVDMCACYVYMLGGLLGRSDTVTTIQIEI